jgi:hypothetical protein
MKALSVLLLLPAVSYADTELSVSNGVNHIPGIKYFQFSVGDDLRFGGGFLVYYDHYYLTYTAKHPRGYHISVEPYYDYPKAFVEVTERFHLGQFTADLGVSYFDKKTMVEMSQFNFSIRTEWHISKDYFLGYQHFSHGSCLGYEENRVNKGYDMILIGMRY